MLTNRLVPTLLDEESFYSPLAITASGLVLIYGSAVVNYHKYINSSIIIGGYAIAEVIDHKGVIINGQAIISKVGPIIIDGGTVLLSGHSLITDTVIIGGSVNISGKSVISSTFHPSGGATISGVSKVIHTITYSKVFSWNVGQGTLKWYSLEGDCQSNKSCPPVNNQADALTCQNRLLLNAQGYSTSDLFQRLLNKKVVFPVKAIKQFSDISSSFCYTLTDITNTTTIPPEFQLLSVEENIIAPIAFSNTGLTENIQQYDSNGIITLSGSFAYENIPYNGITLSGEFGIASSNMQYTSNGNITLSGSFGIAIEHASYNSSGTITLSGNSTINVHQVYTSNGTITLNGNFGYSVPGLEEITATIDVSPSLATEQVIFPFVPADNVLTPFLQQQTQKTVNVNCCSFALPYSLALSHNLTGNANNLSQFLSRNNLTLPNYFVLNYNQATNSWHASQHYTGYAYDLPQMQTWALLFDFSCINNNWKVSFLIKSQNLTTNKSYTTRFLTYFSPSVVCNFNSVKLDFTFNVNVSNKQTNPESVLNTVLNDGAGIFQSSYWLSSLLRMNVSQLPVVQTQYTIYPEVYVPVTSGNEHSTPQ